MRLRSCFFLILATSAFAACGPSVKLDPDGDDGKGSGGQPQSRACEGDYAPISLFIPGMLPINDPESVAAGTYESIAFEFYVRDDQGPAGTVQVHFSETRFGESPVVRPVCKSSLKLDTPVEYSFPALSSLTVTAQGKSRLEATYLIQGQRGKYVNSRVVATAPVATGISEFLRKFTQYRLYQVGPATYEIHGYIQQVTGMGTTHKWVVQRIAVPEPI